MPHPIVGFDSNEENEKKTMKNITSYAIKKKKKKRRGLVKESQKVQKTYLQKIATSGVAGVPRPR